MKVDKYRLVYKTYVTVCTRA